VEDNCPNVPNGLCKGTCVKIVNSTIVDSGSECTDDSDCEAGEICQMNQEDDDGDGRGDVCDICPHSTNQLDTFPPGGNGIGDACDCEGDFDCDGDVDGSDAAKFKENFGRNTFDNPCTGDNSCDGDFDYDTDVDGTDANTFKAEFGRNGFNNPCPTVPTMDPWCSY
jgi:hypothetical protein